MIFLRAVTRALDQIQTEDLQHSVLNPFYHLAFSNPLALLLKTVIRGRFPETRTRSSCFGSSNNGGAIGGAVGRERTEPVSCRAIEAEEHDNWQEEICSPFWELGAVTSELSP